MDEMELHTGTLQEIDIGNSTIEEWSKNKCKNLNLAKEQRYSTYLELLLGTHKEYKLLSNRLYLCNDTKHEDCGIQYVDKRDGNFYYIIRFSNKWHTSLDEMLEESIKYSYKNCNNE